MDAVVIVVVVIGVDEVVVVMIVWIRGVPFFITINFDIAISFRSSGISSVVILTINFTFT